MRNYTLIIIFTMNITFAQLAGIITGEVIDGKTKQPLIGVNIQVIDTDFGAASDLNGYFYINNVPVGTQHISVTMIGYKERIFLNLPVTSARPINVVAELEIDPVQIEAVEVSGNVFSKSSNAIVSTMNVDQSEIRSDPGGAWDIQRVVQSLPSVTTTSDMENEIISRGGARGENLFFMDNIEIQNPNHFGFEGTGGGPINIVNPMFVREIEFTPGAFSARYGDKASSVMDVSLREGSRHHFEYDFDLSMAGAGLNAEGPIASGKGSFLLGTAWSYMDLVVKNIGMTAVPHYNHHQAKIVYDINPKFRLIANGLVAFDNINVKAENEVVSYGAESVDTEGESYVGGLSLRTLLGKIGYGISTIAFTKQRTYHWVYSMEQHDNPWFTRDNTITDLTYRDNWVIQTPAGEFISGLSLKQITYNYAEWAKPDTGYYYDTSLWDGSQWNFPEDVDKPQVTNIKYYQPEWYNYEDGKYWKFAYHLQNKIKFGTKLQLTSGLRADYFSGTEDWVFSPRLNVQFNLNRITTAHIAYGRHYQFPEYYIIAHNDINQDLRAKYADQLVAGAEHFFSKDFRGSLEVYYKKYDDIYTHYYWTHPQEQYPDSLQHIDEYENKGAGKSYGVELFLQKKLTRNWHGILSYAWSRSQAKDVRDFVGGPNPNTEEKAGEWYNWDYDYRHNLTFIGGWKKKFHEEDWYNNIKEKLWYKILGPLNPLADEVELSFRFAYNSGRPYTEKTYMPELFDWATLEDTEWNKMRYPEYQRLDIMYLQRYHFKKLNLVFYIDIMNIFNHKNIWDWAYNRDGSKEEVWQYTTFPVGGVTLEF
ncbi:TonB-dependent receptor [bacterium]|nr:TonB-dependent receptor [bacterium]